MTTESKTERIAILGEAEIASIIASLRVLEPVVLRGREDAYEAVNNIYAVIRQHATAVEV
jgi:hypothetical protein